MFKTLWRAGFVGLGMLTTTVVLGVACVCEADMVTPTARVAESVAVYKETSAHSRSVGDLPIGVSVELLEDVPRWYRIRLADGTEGYVSKAWTVLVADGTADVPETPGADAPTTGIAAASRVTVRPVSRVKDLVRTPPAKGSYRIHLIDVGTGLSILVQGADFSLLFDGGSRDDKRKISASGNGNRLLSYLFAALGPSGPPECVPEGDDWGPTDGQLKTIQHVVLSHPHEDHNSLLPDVLHCYDVKNVWDAGVRSDSAVQTAFLKAVAAVDGVRYHTSVEVPADHKAPVGEGSVLMPATVAWEQFARGDQQKLGETGAKFIVVHADPSDHASDLNLNSIVLRVELGRISLLLTGDIESGDRLPPSAPPARGEQEMLETDPALLDVDILQVAHHGSMTSSRREFLDAVSPAWALISSGPFKYSKVQLPDAVIPAELQKVGATVLETYLNDGRCPVEDRIGLDNPKSRGGCDNYVLEITP